MHSNSEPFVVSCYIARSKKDICIAWSNYAQIMYSLEAIPEHEREWQALPLLVWAGRWLGCLQV